MDEKDLLEKLKQYPDLKMRFEELVKTIENPDQETTLADRAEERVIQAVRSLGREALENWAKQQSNQASAQIKKHMPRAHKHIKKKSTGTPLLEK